MKQIRFNKRNKLGGLLLSIVLLGGTLGIPLHSEAATQVKDQSKLSPGIDYKKLNYTGNTIKNGVNIMEINISDLYTEVQLGKAEPLDKLATVRNRANSFHTKNNKIMGAINANFYSVAEKRPVHLISEDNRLVYAGYVNSDKNQFVNEPIAFGIDKSGKGLIDHYNLKLTYTYNGKNRKISHTNRERATNNTILYTSDFYNKHTNTNQYGTEVVLKGPKNLELTLGSTLELTVDSIRKEGDKNTTPIGKDSFVLSGHGTGSNNLKGMKVGDKVSINVDMDKKWQGSEFMLAGGPQLIKNGKVDISMNTSSWIANAQTSRTVVGVDSKRGKVFFVTTDVAKDKDKKIVGGFTIPQLAKLMKDLGADTALNLDGGGSTTMAIRPNGKGNLKVANKLQDGSERGISGTLLAADTKPERIFKDVSYRADLAEGIHWAHKQGAITGYEDNTFRPYNKLKRKHSAVIFARALNLDTVEPASVEDWFSDVSPDKPSDYPAEIAAVANAEIFKGTDGKFRPEETMTREQMASTIAKAFDLKASDSEKVNISMKGVDPSHQEYVQILADNGVTTELNDFRPRQAVTRGQFAAFLQRASEAK